MSTHKLDKSWETLLAPEFDRPYWAELQTFLLNERNGQKIFPSEENVLRALELTPFSEVRVVILGQDPYHGEGQAHGLSFSVLPGVKPPPSLVNIFKELRDDLGVLPPRDGCLEAWARQGVLLLNNVLTVPEGQPAGHHKKGWEIFTDRIIELINEHKQNVVFILWGSPAQAKAQKVDEFRHFVIRSPHPSPLSAYRGFFGSRPFSRTNDYLRSTGQTPIDWGIR
jgi:uracil-DNA glycosylase